MTAAPHDTSSPEPAPPPDRAAPESSGVIPEAPAPPIAREGWPIVAGFAVGAAIVSAVAYAGLYRIGLERLAYPVAGAALLLVIWCVWFFRDPRRTIPGDAGLFVSPADGVVCLIDRAPPPPEVRAALALDESPLERVCVFMNVFNVHVNRAPEAGEVLLAHHHPGAFLNASLDKASDLNERLSLALRLESGRTLIAVQIAGLVARRIVCRVAPGVRLARGERFGLIRFGSRVDVYLPPGASVRVRVGQRAVAGETVLAALADAGAPGSEPCS